MRPELEDVMGIRALRSSDLPYISNAWSLSNLDTPLAKQLGPEYKRQHAKLIWLWLACSTVHVACDKVDSDAILGFIVRYKKLLHYVHVRRDFRRMGIAQALVDEDDLKTMSMTTTHQIANVSFYRGGSDAKVQGWKYDPYAFLAGPQPETTR